MSTGKCRGAVPSPTRHAVRKGDGKNFGDGNVEKFQGLGGNGPYPLATFRPPSKEASRSCWALRSSSRVASVMSEVARMC